MAYTKKYLESNRDFINAKRRAKYSSEFRKQEYADKRDLILQKGKEDRALCPYCKLDFRRLYIPKHIVTRHKISIPDNLNELICKTIE